MDLDVDKLERLFEKKYKSMSKKHQGKNDEFFLEWCDRHKIVMMHQEWVQDCFNKPHRNMICIMSPETPAGWGGHCEWLLVPKTLAMKALVLGDIPD